MALIAVQRFLGELATDDRQFEAAQDLLGKFLSLAEACQIPYERALKLLVLVELRLAQWQVDDATGLIVTAREVGAELFISPCTVGQHLRSIYNKTGVSTRSAATRWAIEHGLADD